MDSLAAEKSTMSEPPKKVKKRKRPRSSEQPAMTLGEVIRKKQRDEEEKAGKLVPLTLGEAALQQKMKLERKEKAKEEKKKKKRLKKSVEGVEEKVAEAKENEPKMERDAQPIAAESKAPQVPTTSADITTSYDVNLALTEEDLNEDFHTDEEAEEEERRLIVSQQTIKMVYGSPVVATPHTNLQESLARFEADVVDDLFARKAAQPTIPPVATPSLHNTCKCGRPIGTSSSSSSEGESSDSEAPGPSSRKRTRKAGSRGNQQRRQRARNRDDSHLPLVQQEVQWRCGHPAALHREICFNLKDQLNDGPVCRCAPGSGSKGIRHNRFDGEHTLECDIDSCDPSKLFHYNIEITPSPSKQARRASRVLAVDAVTGKPEWFFFEGFSLLFHRPLPSVFPSQPQTRWCEEYAFELVQDRIPEEALRSARALETWHRYVFEGVFELMDLKRWPSGGSREEEECNGGSGENVDEIRQGCPLYHVFPRYIRTRPDGSKILAPISAILDHLHGSYTKPFCDQQTAIQMQRVPALFDSFMCNEKGGIAIWPEKRPCAIRVDVVDPAGFFGNSNDPYPVITHFAQRPTNFTLHCKPEYQTIVANMMRLKVALSANPTDRQLKAQLHQQDILAAKIRSDSLARRESTVSFSSATFRKSGLEADMATHALVLTVAVHHARFHCSLEKLEERIGYKFGDRTLLELALNHPSFTLNYGTNPDHARNTLYNCGVRLPKGRNRRRDDERAMPSVAYDLTKANHKKHGMEKIFELMQMMPDPRKLQISASIINERLEFLGDVVVELIVTVHLFFLLQDQDEGALATFRSALVQNKNLAYLAQRIGLDRCILFSHGVDLCHEAEYRHAIANVFEAFLAAVYLDSREDGIDHCERIYGEAMFNGEPEMHRLWMQLQDHELKAEYPEGDRHLIEKAEALQKLVEFEESIGLKFDHIRLLAKAFTRRSGCVSNLTRGDNQSLELLGDTVLQLACTDYLYKRYPLHHEGHLSLLRTCLVSNRTQSVICDDLQMTKYVIDPKNRMRKQQMKIKDKADLVESLMGAIYVDRGWAFCKALFKACFLPRLKFFINSQRWNDAKSQLQQVCLALPRMPGEAATSGVKYSPEYRIVGVHGPTNTRRYQVSIMFRGRKLATGDGQTVHAAQMNAAVQSIAALSQVFPSEWAAYMQRKHPDGWRKQSRDEQQHDQQEGSNGAAAATSSRYLSGRERKWQRMRPRGGGNGLALHHQVCPQSAQQPRPLFSTLLQQTPTLWPLPSAIPSFTPSVPPPSLTAPTAATRAPSLFSLNLGPLGPLPHMENPQMHRTAAAGRYGSQPTVNPTLPPPPPSVHQDPPPLSPPPPPEATNGHHQSASKPKSLLDLSFGDMWGAR